MTSVLNTTLIAQRPAQQAAASEREQFADLLRGQHPRLAQFVRRLLGWPAQAQEVDDVLQEVYLAAWVHRRRLRSDGASAAWLAKIALHKTRNHVRATRRRQRFMALFGFAPPAPRSPRVDDTPERVRSALARLQHGDRELLVLRYLEHRSSSELRELLGISGSALDARLSRARRRLAEIYPAEESP